MGSRARKNASGEDGFIIIEVLVSALILAIVAGAVLTLITATTRSAASTRNHSVAYDLAQEDQARLRTMRIASLKQLSENNKQPIIVNGSEFHVHSEGFFVNNRAGGISCTEENDTADYVQLTSTVTGPGMIEPVTMRSVVSPSNGSANPSNGTLAIQVTNAANEPVSGVGIKINEGAYSGETEGHGCANFAELPATTPTALYKVKFEGHGLINPKGETSQTVENVSIGAGATVRLPSSWDKGGILKPNFVYLEPGTSTLRTATADTMQVFNSESGQPAATVGTAGGARASSLVKEPLYPFTTKYTAYPGACTSNNPDPEGKVTANDVGLAFVAIPPGGTAEPQIRLPALELTVTTKEGKEGKEGKELIVAGAKVTVIDLKCKPSGTGVKRSYITNLGGHLSNEANGPTEAGLPFSSYKICASATISGELRRAEIAEVKVENLTAGTTQKLNLIKGTPEC